MSMLYESFQQETGRTFNGAKTQETSLSSCVDLFFIAGASRGKDITTLVAKAYAENPEVTLRITQWLRDVRGGAGERQQFKNVINYIASVDKVSAEKLLPKIPEIGRWDDYLGIEDKELRLKGYTYISKALLEGNGLCAKWMPRKGQKAVELTKFLKLTPKQYRKKLVSLTNVVETQMCNKQWGGIDFEKVPSLASARYQKAFERNCDHYEEYVEKLSKGEAKVNASAVYPYDVVKSVNHGNKDVANAQWKALPNYMEDNTSRILPVVDVSGSMTCSAGGNQNLTCMDVAVSLGLYISERNEGIFKDVFMTFSESPRMHKLQGDLYERMCALKRTDWGFSTNLQAVYKQLLLVAKNNMVHENEMPTTIVVLSDMEFNQAFRGNVDISLYEDMQKEYESSNYDLPNVVFWNINGREGNVPVSFDKAGTALISGFSPSIMKSVLSGEDMTAEKIMLDTIMVDRYSF